MSMMLKEQAVETVHDRVVNLVAERWAKAFVCKVTIRTGHEHHAWADRDQPCDIVGWYVSSGGNTMEWMAEVETEESLSDAHTADKWKRAMIRGIPFYLVVPCGLKDAAFKLAEDAAIAMSCIYEFTFINGVFHVL